MSTEEEQRTLINEIVWSQEEEEISKLLKKAKRFSKNQTKDPVYNQLFVEWQSNFVRTKRVKTELNLSQNHSRHRFTNKKQLNHAGSNKHRKYFSQSVQLPKISKKFNVPHNINEEDITKDIMKHNNQKYQPSSDKNRPKNALGANVWSTYQSRNGTINSEQQQNETKSKKHNLLKPHHQIINRRMNKARKQKNNGGINKQWLIIDILKIDTYFAQMKKQRKQQKIQIKIDSIQEQLTLDELYLPHRDKVSQFISSYKPINPVININQLVKKPSFKVIHEEGQSIYFGEINQAGKKSQLGIFMTALERFEGRWRNNQKVEGYEITSQGYYKGKFKGGRRHGEGQFFWKNGQYYSGEWFKGMKHGSGIWKSGKGDTYIGEWRSGNVQGYGVHSSSNGQRYEGQFIEFLKQGKGNQKFPNGDVYEGNYRRGKPYGKGKYTWKNQIVYEGEFVNSIREGKGKMYAENYVYFEGSFKNDRAIGMGHLKYQNGDEYKGEFQRGEKHGNGLMKLTSQKKILSGEWRNNCFEFEAKK